MMTFYDHYVVHNARARVTYTNLSTTTPNVCLSANGSSSAPSGAQLVIESGLLARDILGPQLTTNCSQTLELYIDIAKFTGVPSLITNPDTKGTVTSNPVEQVYFNVSAWDVQSLSSTVVFDIEIDYDITFFEPRKLTASLAQPKKLVPSESKLPDTMTPFEEDALLVQTQLAQSTLCEADCVHCAHKTRKG
jgi:hypothetical protein